MLSNKVFPDENKIIERKEPLVLKISQRNVTPNKSKTKKSKKSFLLRHTIEFFKTTGLHGYKYIVMENTPIFERILWGVAVLICLIAAIVLVMVAWQWNVDNPTITVIESTHFAIWKIPFPAVTICNLNKVSRPKAIEFTQKLIIPKSINMTSDDIMAKLKYMSAILGNAYIDDETRQELDRLQTILDYNNITIRQLAEKLSPSCDEMLERCSWKGATTRCDSIFQPTISTEGFCCTFNYYGYKKSNFPPKVALFRPKYPRRIAACGYQTALSVLFKTMPNDYHSSTFGTYGVRIYVHDSYDYPDENSSAKLIGPGTEAFFEISPEMTYATSSINGLPVQKRKCIFPSEGDTYMFNRYTYSNCLAECRTDIVYEICNCTPYFLPNNASFGGLLGLFVGFSLVSGFELVYFFTLRFFFDMLHKNEPPENQTVGTKKGVTETGLGDSQLFNKWVQKHNSISIISPTRKTKKKKSQSKKENTNQDAYHGNIGIKY